MLSSGTRVLVRQPSRTDILLPRAKGQARSPRCAGQWLRGSVLLVALVLLVTGSGCRRAEEAPAVVYLLEPGQLVTLDPRDGHAVWRAAVPLDYSCAVSPSPDGRWVALVSERLVLVPTSQPEKMLVVDPPPGWFFTSCNLPYGTFVSTITVLSWVQQTVLFAMLRKNLPYPDEWAVAAYDVETRSWRSWMRQLPGYCPLLGSPVAHFAATCAVLPSGIRNGLRLAQASGGLLAIDPTSGVLLDQLPIPRAELAARGLRNDEPIVTAATDGRSAVLLLRNALLVVLDRDGTFRQAVAVDRELGLAGRAYGVALRLVPKDRVAWVVVQETGASDRPILALVDLRDQSVVRVVDLPGFVRDVDFLPDGTVVLNRSVETAAEQSTGAPTWTVVRRDLRRGDERVLATLTDDGYCCWIGPLAPEARAASGR